MVERCRADSRLLERVAEVYDWLEQQIHQNDSLSGACRSCGNCCDFEAFDHRLFVTLPELTYFTASLDGEKVKAMPAGRCPYNVSGKCSVYEHRFAGCRIFCCNGDAVFQGELSESALTKLKAICAEFRIPYRYMDLATSLNGLAGT
ncbi:MAG: YkgJ family cysteine cluster protein [Planctomycetota bacterium]|jgi:Fe-S-cluster containining protein